MWIDCELGIKVWIIGLVKMLVILITKFDRVIKNLCIEFSTDKR
jgi:hypothetical protein